MQLGIKTLVALGARIRNCIFAMPLLIVRDLVFYWFPFFENGETFDNER